MIRQPIWTRRQLSDLKTHYESGVPIQAIAEALGRTASAIKTRAQLNGFRRPRRCGSKEVEALKTYAAKLGLDEASLPTAPSELRILICLSQIDISSKPGLDKACSIGDSARNKAIRALRLSGLALVDNFCSPSEVILTRKAYRSRPEPVLADNDQIRLGVLPSMTKLCSELDSWLPAICRKQASIDMYRCFIIRKLENTQTGDITPADFYSIFYDLKRH